MKNLLITAALVAITATAAAADLSLVRTSVIDNDGQHRSGFRTIGGTITRYVSASSASMYDFPENVVVVPAGVDTANLGEVQAYLASIGVEATPLIRTPTHNRTREVSDGMGGTVTKEYTVSGRSYW